MRTSGEFRFIGLAEYGKERREKIKESVSEGLYTGINDDSGVDSFEKDISCLSIKLAKIVAHYSNRKSRMNQCQQFIIVGG